jgi:hypothetical protein
LSDLSGDELRAVGGDQFGLLGRRDVSPRGITVQRAVMT